MTVSSVCVNVRSKAYRAMHGRCREEFGFSISRIGAFIFPIALAGRPSPRLYMERIPYALYYNWLSAQGRTGQVLPGKVLSALESLVPASYSEGQKSGKLASAGTGTNSNCVAPGLVVEATS